MGNVKFLKVSGLGMPAGRIVTPWVVPGQSAAANTGVGLEVGEAEGFAVGFEVGEAEGFAVGFEVGEAEGFAVGFEVGETEGFAVGERVGLAVGPGVKHTAILL
uniref:Essential protein Yae1 N-terminal domain-containing protein n=1 Tax=Lotharella globosa TaxID=91324 RepID=A0A7S4DEY4_9EUKA